MGLVLGIESSCDETAAALVTSDRTILAQRIASQDAEHAPYGGVVPEIAARAHAERLAPMIAAVLKDAGKTLDDCDAIAATAGPGLIGGVMVGLVSAKALAMASDTPLIAINHLEGHALSPRLADPTLDFPYLLLLASGGHCQILLVEGVGRYTRLATTIDDALLSAREALALHISGMIADGERIPPAGTLPAQRDPAIAAVAMVPVTLPGRKRRVNVSLDEGLLAAIDAVTDNRSGFLERAARRELAAD